MPSQRRLYAILTAVACIFALALALRQPISDPMPGYLDDLREWAATGHIADTFTPLAYPLFAAPAYRIAGLRGVALLQAALLLALFAISIKTLRELQLPARWAALGALLILFHPDLFLSVAKIWDVALSTTLLLLIVLLALARRGPAIALALGVAFGCGLFCRPNYIFLAAPILYALLTAPSPPAPRPAAPRALAAFAAILATAALVFALLGAAAHGRPFLPRNGPYNLYAGNNPYTAATLWTSLNAETSIYPAFNQAYPGLAPTADYTPAYTAFFYSPALEPLYTRQSLLFARAHPVQEARLIALKAFTLFRPDTKVHPLRSFAGLLKLVLALPAALLLTLLLLPGRPALARPDRLLFLVYAAYILPFLLTNSDPRFRTPLDALLLLHIVRLLFLRLSHRTPAPVPLAPF